MVWWISWYLFDRTNGKVDGLGRPSVPFFDRFFGASAVLAYGAPQAPFSQPRNITGGHCISAIVGVSVYLLLGDAGIFACPLAVSLAIVAMQLTDTVHPPGGATALIAVIGGSTIHDLGYWYVLCPVALGACIMVGVAWVVNNLSVEKSRKYRHKTD